MSATLTDQQTAANNDLLLSLSEILQPLLARGPIATVCVIGSKELNHVEVAVWSREGRALSAGFCSNEDIVFLLPLICDAYETGLLGPKPWESPLLTREFVYVVATADCEDFTTALHFVEPDDAIRAAAQSVIASIVEMASSKLAVLTPSSAA